MNENVVYIRAERTVLQKSDNGKFKLLQEYKTINAAKRFTRTQPLGTVARRETIVREHGIAFYRGLLA